MQGDLDSESAGSADFAGVEGGGGVKFGKVRVYRSVGFGNSGVM